MTPKTYVCLLGEPVSNTSIALIQTLKTLLSYWSLVPGQCLQLIEHIDFVLISSIFER